MPGIVAGRGTEERVVDAVVIMPVLLDFESRSRADLSEIGGRLYWGHPSSEALCCVWYDTRDGSVGVWYPGQAWPHAGRTLAAHNAAGFDRFAAERYGFAAAGWIDTSQLARKAGLPGSLDALGTRWCGVPKDSAGSKYTKALSSVRRPAGKRVDAISAAEWSALSDFEKRARGVQPEITPEVLARVVDYCASDVAILAQSWPRLREWLPVDADVEALDTTINARGVCFDRALAERLLAEDARISREAIAGAAAEIGASPEDVAAAARSPAQFCALTGAPNAQAETVEGMAWHPLARARMALASIARGKLEAGLARVSADGRMRDTLRYYGACTGRWSGTGMQLQNLPRPAKRLEGVDVDTLAAEVLAGRHCDADEVALLVRATLTASPGCMLAVCDFASVEARATAWAAGDVDALDVFRSGRDPYKVAAATVFGVEYDTVDKAQRQIGKVCELALGYGGGPNALEKMAHAYRCALSALNTRQVVDAWRALHLPIQSLWYECERAFRSAVDGGKRWAGPFEFVAAQTGDAVACFLPGGRPIVYQHAAAEGRELTYEGTRGREHVYGGKIVENAIQALCRDLMAAAMLRAEAAGLRVVLTVHDEIVCDVPAADAQRAYDTLHACMMTLPPWAVGFPIGADGWVGFRYRK